MEIGIGTVQFGLDYGISNNTGRVELEEVKKIIEFAQNKGIRYLDSAPLYGQSEETLGKISITNKFRIITKTIKMEKIRALSNPYTEFAQEFERSLNRLNTKSVYGLMVHDPNDLMGTDSDRVWEILENHKKAGEAEKIGVSIYNESEIVSIIDRYPIDIIQIPISIMDQRLLQTNILKKLKKMTVEIHARSIFLQGSIFMNPEKLPGSLKTFMPVFSDFSDRVKKSGYTPFECAIGFIKNIPDIDVVVIGINSLEQLTQIIHSWAAPIDLGVFSDFKPSANPQLLNPANWVLS